MYLWLNVEEEEYAESVRCGEGGRGDGREEGGEEEELGRVTEKGGSNVPITLVILFKLQSKNKQTR